MTEKESTTGTVMTVAVNPATNQIVGQPYDANGNMLGQTVTYMLNGQQITGPSNTWDAENRLSFQVLDGTPYQYTYDPSGRRVVTQNMAPFGGVVKTTFYGAAGERVTWGATSESYVRFAGRTISLGTREVRDRLGSVRATETGQNFQYMPYGEAEGGVVADGRVRFGTYVRDSTPSAQDYAGARYYSNVYGRFFGADPGGIATANPNNPSSWNRYAYVGGDPVNHADPRGLDWLSCDFDDLCDPYLTGETAFGYGNAMAAVNAFLSSVCNGGSNMSAAFLGLTGGQAAFCGALGLPTGPPPAPLHVELEVTSDCYTPNPLVPGVFTREVTYAAFAVHADETNAYEITGNTPGSVIAEQHTYAPGYTGYQPPISPSSPNSPFFDQYSVGNNGYFSETQTFSLSVTAGTYSNVEIRDRNGNLWSSNSVTATNGYVDINGDKNLLADGSPNLCGKH
jgi:RHS repeat-associated protein